MWRVGVGVWGAPRPPPAAPSVLGPAPPSGEHSLSPAQGDAAGRGGRTRAGPGFESTHREDSRRCASRRRRRRVALASAQGMSRADSVLVGQAQGSRRRPHPSRRKATPAGKNWVYCSRNRGLKKPIGKRTACVPSGVAFSCGTLTSDPQAWGSMFTANPRPRPAAPPEGAPPPAGWRQNRPSPPACACPERAEQNQPLESWFQNKKPERLREPDPRVPSQWPRVARPRRDGLRETHVPALIKSLPYIHRHTRSFGRNNYKLLFPSESKQAKQKTNTKPPTAVNRKGRVPPLHRGRGRGSAQSAGAPRDGILPQAHRPRPRPPPTSPAPAGGLLSSPCCSPPGTLPPPRHARGGGSPACRLPG